MTTNKNHNSPNVPNLRFPEFKGEWEMIKVSDLLDFYSTNSLSWEQLDYNNGKIKNLHYGLIHKGLPTMVDVAYDSLPYIKEEFMLKSFTLLKEGDVAFADASEDTNDVAKAIEVVNCNNQQIVSGLHTIHGRDNSNRTVIGYKGYAFASDSFHKQIRRIAQGTKVFSISVRNFDEVYIGIPSKEEQTKISKLLTAIDKRIATQNKIIEKLQSLIKGLVDSLLENPSWEKVYLCSFMQFYSTNSLSWEQLSYSNGNVRNMHYGLIHGFQMSLIDSTLLPRILPNYLPKQYTVCQDGDVVFADASEDTNEIGKAIEFSNTINVKTVCGLHTIHGRDIKQNTILGFKGFAFNSRYFHDQVRRLAQGTKVYSITAKNLSSCFVYIPDVIKQENIVRLLNAYEENLSLNRTLLNKYEIQKQYLLQQMLI